MNLHRDAPAALAGRRLFEPIAALLAHFASTSLPDAARLTALVREAAPHAASGGGRPIRFALPAATAFGYEEHVFETGEVPARADDWHDFFNALAWCVWPRSKAACNALHLEHQ